MRFSKTIFTLVILFALALVGSSGLFIVDETNQAFVTRWGKPVGNAITNAGLHFKVPMIDRVRFFDQRYLEWDGDPNQVTTQDKRYIFIDTFARWKIDDPITFFENLTDETMAQTRLDDILDGATRNAVAKYDLVEIVRSIKREEQSEDVETGEGIGTLEQFEVGRDQVTREVLKEGQVNLQKWGIDLLDIRFKRINYEASVQTNIMNRMISERQKVAEKYRSQGQGEAASIQGETELQLKSIRSEAERQVQEIRGKADAEAAQIYAAAYNQSTESRTFYEFLKTLETYQNTLSTNDQLILSTDSQLYQFLKGDTGQPASE